jgi:hypothetical protein
MEFPEEIWIIIKECIPWILRKIFACNILTCIRIVGMGQDSCYLQVSFNSADSNFILEKYPKYNLVSCFYENANNDLVRIGFDPNLWIHVFSVHRNFDPNDLNRMYFYVFR